MSTAESRRIMLGELLLRAGVISEAQLSKALAEQKKWGGKLGHLLVELNFLDEDTLVKALSKQLGLPRVDFRGLTIAPEVLQKMDPQFAEQRQVMPIAYDPGKKILVVAMADPADLGLADEISFRSGCQVRAAIGGERALARAIREYYFGENMEVPVSTAGDDASMNVERLVPTESAAGGGGGGKQLEDKVARLEQLQRKQVHVLKVVIELLIERGYINQEEYRAKVER